jgi:hypothetical protein
VQFDGETEFLDQEKGEDFLDEKDFEQVIKLLGFQNVKEVP